MVGCTKYRRTNRQIFRSQTLHIIISYRQEICESDFHGVSKESAKIHKRVRKETGKSYKIFI